MINAGSLCMVDGLKQRRKMNNREISEQIQEDIRTYMSGITGEEDKESLVDNLCEIISYRFMIESK